MKASESIRFSSSPNDFFNTLNKRVNEYFKTRNISRYSNTKMVIKTICMFSLYIIPFAIILSGVTNNLFILFGLAVVMGLASPELDSPSCMMRTTVHTQTEAGLTT
jgi:linoleoyl-CoA desaturase